MERVISSWWSPALQKPMEIVRYGSTETAGPALLMFPSAAADYLEYERFHLIDSMAPMINAGALTVYSINSINSESWLNHEMQPRNKAIRHQQYNQYVVDEVVPHIRQDSGHNAPIITSGVSLGALHGVNSFFRRPDLFAGTIGMSGIYDLKAYTKGYFDEDCYFNSPVDFLPNLQDDYLLGLMRSRSPIIVASGCGPYEDPSASQTLSAILHAKQIPHTIELWDQEWSHDWPTWRAMMPHLLGRALRNAL